MSNLSIIADTDGSGHLIWIVIVLLFWGVSALGSVLKKAGQASKAPRPAPPPLPRNSAAPGELPLAAMMPPMPPRSAPQRRAMPRAHDAGSRVKIPPRSQGVASIFTQQAPMRSAARIVEAVRRAATPRLAPPLPPVQQAVPAPVKVQPAPAPAMATKVTQPISIHRAESANASRLRAWLRPATMRKQFILTELLQPPKSLRDDSIGRL